MRHSAMICLPPTLFRVGRLPGPWFLAPGGPTLPLMNSYRKNAAAAISVTGEGAPLAPA